jgi:hypothetical protein
LNAAANRLTIRSRRWYIRIDADGRTIADRPGFTDGDATQAEATRLLKLAERGDAGPRRSDCSHRRTFLATPRRR